ncbi:MAG: helix-turn-helix domain-containing protein [Patulibacter sp.]
MSIAVTPRQEQIGLPAALARSSALLADRIVARQLRAAPELALPGEPGLEELLRDANELAITFVLGILQQGPGGDVDPPPAIQRLVRESVNQGIGALAILRAGRCLQAELTDAGLRLLVAEHAPLSAVADWTVRVARICGAFVDGLVRIHRERRAEVEVQPESVRTRLVRSVLAGGPAGALGYPMDGPHVALLARGRTAGIGVRRLIGEFPGATLLARGPDQGVWLWLATDCGDEEVAERWRRAVSGGSAGIGAAGCGVEGFRASHRKARMALRMARRGGSSVVAYSACALETLAFGDASLADEFVATELGPLLDDEPRVVVLRDTLDAYFAAGSAAAAAALLDVSERTIVYRLRTAEQLLGHPLSMRRAEIEAALRLRPMVPGTSISSTPPSRSHDEASVSGRQTGHAPPHRSATGKARTPANPP